MTKASKPINEEERLNALQSYDILDTLPENSYDEITKLASFICETPISLVSLIDNDRQYFKSKVGLTQSETNRDYAFCAHSILVPGERTIVEDARLDKRFEDNPLVVGDPHIVFYAGVPLITSEGFALGTLCVIDKKPRSLSEEQLDALKSLSNQVVKLLELRKSNRLFEEAQQKLQGYSDEMEAFAYMTSHDLKEPARMVKSFMRLLDEKYSGQLDEEAKKYIYFAVDGAERMTELIDEMLIYSRLKGLSANREKIDLTKLLEEIVAFQSGIIREKNAIVEYQNLPVIEASATAIKIVFQNLIGNALKYQLPGVQPVIKITAKENQTYWEFAVADNGIGIAKENSEIIFQVFKRLHSRSEYSGTGMGLATCKKIVKDHKGEIWLTSELERGSVFHFTISKNLG